MPDFIRSGHCQRIRLSLKPVKTERASGLFVKVLEGHRQWLSVKAICERLNSAGFDAVLAGGSVRDALMGVSPKDFDVATSATPDDVEGLFEKTVNVGKSFGVIIVPIEDGAIEIATYRRDGDYEDGRRPTGVIFSDRKEDAKRRDFTVNALFYDPVQNSIIDYVDGRKDIEKKILRVVGDPALRFKEDKLRLLRAVRFSGQLGFEIEAETAAAIRTFAKTLEVVSRERIRDEVDKLLMANSASRGFEAMRNFKLDEIVFRDWASALLPPHQIVFVGEDLETRRLLFLWPALKKATPNRVQERLQEWKYGRGFTELAVWMIANEKFLRPSSKDLILDLKKREDVIRDFKIDFAETVTNPEVRIHTPFALEWMNALELWTNEKAAKGLPALDILMGADPSRTLALSRRGLNLGGAGFIRAKAEALLSKPGGMKLQGPLLGRELKRLSRELLLFANQT